MHDQFMEMLKERDEDGSCIVGGLNYAGEAYDRLEAQAKEIERLREALRNWDALIQYQYTGSREAMSALQACAFETDEILNRAALEEKE